MKRKLLTAAAAMCCIVANAQTARVQVIHNCADMAADSVDVYLNGTKLLSGFAFRTATPFINAPAGTPLNLGVAPNHSMSVADTIYNTTVTLDSGGEYVLVADGIVSPTGYSPSSAVAPFRLSTYTMARETATMAGQTDVLVEHGCTDAPTVEIKAGGSVLVSDLSFGNFCGTGYLDLPTANDTINVTDSAGTTILFTYSAPLAMLGLGDSAITVVASGFVDTAANSGGPSFGLWAALREGGALVELPKLPNPTEVKTLAVNGGIRVYPNPAVDKICVDADEMFASVAVVDLLGNTVLRQAQVKNPTLDLSRLPAGMYIVKTFGVSGTVSQTAIQKD
jgi:Secretion system C-terminal sorting domain/Domain of unknown function (DUF4397)